MPKYLYRTCPKCGDYLGVVVRDPSGPKSEIPIDAYCVVCGFKLGWKVVLRKKSSLKQSTHRKESAVQLLERASLDLQLKLNRDQVRTEVTDGNQEAT
jgi:hypothetical protein